MKSMPDQEKVSPVEVFKKESNFLRGAIGEELVDSNDFFGKGSIQLLKHHGTYQQDDRDRRGQGGKSFMFMVRTRIPGGRLTSRQFLDELDLCDEVGDATIRITSRQGLQLHGVLKSNLHNTLEKINKTQLTTLGACGDVNRNVMCCPAPYKDKLHQQIQELSDRLANHFAPRTGAYHELWLKDLATEENELVGGGVADQSSGGEVEPIYGQTYLPRKFKMAISFAHDNCVDLYTHDLGMLAVVKDGEIAGYNFIVGGGQGVTPASKKTFPALGKRMAFVPPGEVLQVAEAVVRVQRDFGNRADRKQARLKYLIHNWGIEKFKAQVEEYYGGKLSEPDPADVEDLNDHMGWEEQGDGKLFYGLNIENGRIADSGPMRLKSALRAICEKFEPGVHLTSHQSLLLTDLSPVDRDEVEIILQNHGVGLTESISTARRWSMACVAWPTCGLSITESERALPGIIDQMEVELKKLELSDERFTIRMTGCPNGCARPYNSDVGLVGKAKGKYTVLLGGRVQGDRLNFVYKDMVPADEVVSTLARVLAYFKQDREAGEAFGDFCNRKGGDDLRAWTESNAGL